MCEREGSENTVGGGPIALVAASFGALLRRLIPQLFEQGRGGKTAVLLHIGVGFGEESSCMIALLLHLLQVQSYSNVRIHYIMNELNSE